MWTAGTWERGPPPDSGCRCARCYETPHTQPRHLAFIPWLTLSVHPLALGPGLHPVREADLKQTWDPRQREVRTP